MRVSASKDRIEKLFGEINTCKKAHQLISGLPEEKCLFQA